MRRIYSSRSAFRVWAWYSMQRGSFPGRSSSLYGWLLVGVVGCIGYLIFRKTKSYWMKLLFPVGWETDWYIPNNAHRFLVRYVQCRYYLYTTRLGYGLHLRRLSKKRHGPHSITQPLSLSGNSTIYTPCANLPSSSTSHMHLEACVIVC